MCKLINEEKRSTLLPTDLFLHPTIRQLSGRVDSMKKAKPKGPILKRCISTPAFSDVLDNPLPSIPPARYSILGFRVRV